MPINAVDLELRFGELPPLCAATQHLSLTAGPWSASLSREVPCSAWDKTVVWPFGAMAGAVLASAEAFKCSMRKLRPFARNQELFDEFFKPVTKTEIALAAPGTPMPSDLGTFDVISGGAITNGLLYALSRIPEVRGIARVIEPDIAEATNLNRYMLLLADRLGRNKATQLSELALGGLWISPVPVHFEGERTIGTLDHHVLVGVDHIPTRWNVQRAAPSWVGVGATTHWSAMASFHTPGLPCVGCLHPRDDATGGPIPTVAFVSLMAALFQTTYFLQCLGSESPMSQQVYLTLPRPEKIWRSGIALHTDCPIGHPKREVA